MEEARYNLEETTDLQRVTNNSTGAIRGKSAIDLKKGGWMCNNYCCGLMYFMVNFIGGGSLIQYGGNQ